MEGIQSSSVDEDSPANGKFHLQGRGSCKNVDRSVRVITGIVSGFADLNSAPFSYCSVVGLCTPCKYRYSGRYVTVLTKIPWQMVNFTYKVGGAVLMLIVLYVL